MNRKEIMSAAVWVGIGLGYKVHAYDLEEWLEDLHAGVLKYIPMAIEMAEAACDMAMEWPEGWQRSLFDDFGDWYAEWFSDNSHEHPDKDQVAEWMVENTCSEFEDDLNEEQLKKLERVLTVIGEHFNP